MKALTVSLMATTLLMAAQSARADHEKEMKSAGHSQVSASEIIGKKVSNTRGEDLGKVQDIIVNVESGTAPYAVITSGGVLGGKRSRTAVPMSALQCDADGALTIKASREEFLGAGRTATGAWAPVADTAWARRVDAYYGQPEATDRYARERLQGTNTNDTRTFVRDPQPKGAEMLMSPQDAALCQRICESIDATQVRVENGVTHIYGQVENEEARKNLEAKIRSVPGVNTVESHLKVKNR